MQEILSTTLSPHKRIFQGVMSCCNYTRGSYRSFLVTILIVNVLTRDALANSLCEVRCQAGTPHLQPLKVVWRKTVLRLENKDVSFEEFVAALVLATDHHSRLAPIRERLLTMMAVYRDCLKTCEYHHSKRSGLSRKALHYITQHGVTIWENVRVYHGSQ